MEKEIERCEHCHAKLPPQLKRRGARRRFCSTDCRVAAHSARHKLMAEQKMQWLRDHVSFDGEECLKWPFGENGYGYAGSILVDGRHQPACRVMCKLAHGPAPTSKHEAAHSCGKGTEGCINPKHLRWATSAENGADRRMHTLQRQSKSVNDDETLGLLQGAGPLALFIFGDEKKSRFIYGLSDQEKKDYGLFYMGKLICGLKSTIRARIAARAAGQV